MPPCAHPVTSRAVTLAVALALGVATVAPARAASVRLREGGEPGPVRNVRFGVELGGIGPRRWEPMDHGYGLWLRAEVEHSPRWSPFVAVGFGRLAGTRRVVTFTGMPEEQRETVRFADATVGARLHLVRAGALRPFLDLGAAARDTDAEAPVLALIFDGPGGRHVDADGLCGVVRAGLSSARWSEGGLTADVGYQFVARNPGDFGAFQARLGIVFP